MSKELEIAKIGMANGVASITPLTNKEKEKMITKATTAYGKFLDALQCDWRNDPNSNDTPRRVAKAYVHDLWAGRYNGPPAITGFPSDGYDGLVFEGGIPLTSMCSHHHQTINGKVHIGYIASKDGTVNNICEGNLGVAVRIDATHNCVSCRGVRHAGASMKTSKLSGSFLNEDSARAEFYEFCKGYKC